MKKLSVVLLFVLFLASCSQVQTLPPATVTDTITPFLSPTPTLRPTRTPGPTRTRPPTPTITPTSIYPTIQPHVVMPETVNISDWPVQPICARKTEVWRSDISPDGQWLASDECYDPYPTLVVFNKAGTKNWRLHYLDYTNHPEDGLLDLEKWSIDSRYAYFYSIGSSDAIGCYYNHSGYGLFRLDLETGETSIVLSLRPDGYPYIWSFSPTGRRLLYQPPDSSLHFLDLKAGVITHMQSLPDHIDYGGFLWSPDGLTIAFTLTRQAPDGHYTYYLDLIDVSSTSLRTLMTSQPDQCLKASSWLNERSLAVYTAFDYSDEPGTEIEVTIPTKP